MRRGRCFRRGPLCHSASENSSAAAPVPRFCCREPPLPLLRCRRREHPLPRPRLRSRVPSAAAALLPTRILLLVAVAAENPCCRGSGAAGENPRCRGCVAANEKPCCRRGARPTRGNPYEDPLCHNAAAENSFIAADENPVCLCVPRLRSGIPSAAAAFDEDPFCHNAAENSSAAAAPRPSRT